jgi:hypothetical protein
MSLLLLLMGAAVSDQSTAWEMRPTLRIDAVAGAASVTAPRASVSVSPVAPESHADAQAPSVSVSEQRPH